jgi:alanyl-tRNA synthetase
MSERLYYSDAYCTGFTAEVVEARTEGGRSHVVLDRTAFYPTSGGQPFDTGTLGGLPVVEVLETGEGVVRHVVEGRLEEGRRVEGSIDWRRRFDHMQQHTGQHILSAAFERLLQAPTVGFHLGGATATIDLAVEATAGAVSRAETEANRVVWEDRPVSVRFVSAAAAAALPLRKPPARSGTLRLIDIEDFDLSACGGTHVTRTGAVGVIAVRGFERFKRGTRVEFVCGGRALVLFHEFRQSVDESIRHLSVLPAELPAAIERTQAEIRDLERTLRGVQESLARHEAALLSARGTRHGEITCVAEALEGWDAAGLKAVAAALGARPGHAAVLIAGSPAQIVVSRSPGVPIEPAAILRKLTARFGGRGGGRGDLAQGGGLEADPAAILEEARRILRGMRP